MLIRLFFLRDGPVSVLLSTVLFFEESLSVYQVHFLDLKCINESDFSIHPLSKQLILAMGGWFLSQHALCRR